MLATDIPLSERQLRRLCRRALVGLSRTGSYCGNGSGEIVIAFTTANRVPHYSEKALLPMTLLHDDAINFVPGGGRVRGGKRSQQPAPRRDCYRQPRPNLPQPDRTSENRA